MKPGKDGFWDWMNSNAAGISAVAAIATAIVAVIALVRTTNDSRDRTRPIVMAAFETEPDADRDSYSLVIRNMGPTSARDLEVNFEPDVPHDSGDRLVEYIVERFASPMPVLAPGQAIRSLWASYVATSGAERTNRLATPHDVTVTLTYRGAGSKKYSETYPLLALTMTHNVSVVSSASTRGAINRIAASVEELAKSAKSIGAASEKS